MKSGSFSSFMAAAPPEMFGEPCAPGDECRHGIPDDMACWECRYEMLFDDYTAELEAAEDAEDRAGRADETARVLAEEISDLNWSLERMADWRDDEIKKRVEAEEKIKKLEADQAEWEMACDAAECRIEVLEAKLKTMREINDCKMTKD